MNVTVSLFLVCLLECVLSTQLWASLCAASRPGGMTPARNCHDPYSNLTQRTMYNRSQMTSLRTQSNFTLHNSIIDVIEKLGISRSLPSKSKQSSHNRLKRGRRGGSHTKLPIATILGNRPKRHVERNPGCNSANLINITKDSVTHSTRGSHAPTMLCNPRSLVNKVDELEVIVNNNSVDVAAICESWFPPDQPEQMFDISGYDLFSRPRSNKKGGGVAVYVKQNPNASRMKVTVPDNLEVIWVKLRPFRSQRSIPNIVVAAVYSPPPLKALSQTTS